MIAVVRAVGQVELLNVTCRSSPSNWVAVGLISSDIQMFDFLADDPRCHRVYVKAGHVAANAVGLDQGRAAAHERISDFSAGKIVASEVEVGKWCFTEFGKRQRPEQAAGPPSEPLVYGDYGAVVLLNLLLTQRHGGNEGNIEAGFNGHERVSASKDHGRKTGVAARGVSWTDGDRVARSPWVFRLQLERERTPLVPVEEFFQGIAYDVLK